MSSAYTTTPVAVQEAYISSNLNSLMLLSYLMGIYTIVYGFTMYLHLSGGVGNTNRRIVMWAISALYLTFMVDSILQWYSIYWGLVISGDTRENMFWDLQGGPEWVDLPNEFLFKFMIVLSDCLLIWRCYHVWGQSFWAIWAPLAFLFFEFSLCVLATISQGANIDALCNLYTYFVGALNLISLATTITATSMIGFKINSASRVKGSSSRNLLKYVVVVIIESAAPYSLVLLLEAIASFIPSFNLLGSPANDFYAYLDTVMTFVAGMAPTVLVARVALKNSENAAAVSASKSHISELRFGSQQRSHNASSY